MIIFRCQYCHTLYGCRYYFEGHYISVNCVDCFFIQAHEPENCMIVEPLMQGQVKTEYDVCPNCENEINNL